MPSRPARDPAGELLQTPDHQLQTALGFVRRSGSVPLGLQPGQTLLEPGEARLELSGVDHLLGMVLSGLAPASITCALGRAATSRYAASRMASTVMVRRRNWSLRHSAGTDWWWRERGRRKLRSSS